MKKEKRRLSGSYTVEASFIFPMIVIVIIFIFYLMFFVHDKCVINAAADQAALRGSRVSASGGSVYQETENSVRELLDKRLLAAGNLIYDITVSSKEIQVVCKGEILIPFRDTRLPIEVIGYAKRQDPVTFIRECRIIEEKTGGQ